MTLGIRTSVCSSSTASSRRASHSRRITSAGETVIARGSLRDAQSVCRSFAEPAVQCASLEDHVAGGSGRRRRRRRRRRNRRIPLLADAVGDAARAASCGTSRSDAGAKPDVLRGGAVPRTGGGEEARDELGRHHPPVGVATDLPRIRRERSCRVRGVEPSFVGLALSRRGDGRSVSAHAITPRERPAGDLDRA